MDPLQSTRAIFDRIQKMEPELVSKIVGYLLLKEISNPEMLRLAYGPENTVQSLINEAKVALSIIPFSSHSAHVSPQQSSGSLQYVSYSSTLPQPICSPETRNIPTLYWEHQPPSDHQPAVQNIEVVHSPYSNPIGEDIHIHSQTQFFGLEEQPDTGDSTMSNSLNNNYYNQNASFTRPLSPITSRRSLSLPEFPVKACHYYYKGYCRHGTSCRYFHGQTAPNSSAQVQSPSSNELANDEHFLSPDSLEKLEVELTELLKSREGQPISIAMLPLMYYEKYGRQLQADGYLTESQRQGKAGYSLTKLLARLKNSIRLLDRPHGQHSVVLAEDIPRNLEHRNERSDFGNVASGSQQIYLTFPSESTFTEDDVFNYFKQYGPVQAVRIPTQQKRMFGFVTFVYPETVKMILAKGNPHYVCGSRVLVKPYKEKTRKYSEKFDYPIYYRQYTEVDHGIHPSPRFNNEMPRKQLQQLNEQQDPTLEFQLKRLAEFQIASMPVVQQPYLSSGAQEMRISDPDILSDNHFSYHHFASTDVPTNNENTTGNNNNDQDSQIELPDSPFASYSIESSISRVI